MYIIEVSAGETLESIAERTGVTVDALMTTNGLPSAAVTRGQALLVPSQRYIVQRGDSLWAIQQKTGVPVNELRRANPGADRILYPGRPLRIPQPRKTSVEVMSYLPITDPGVTAADIAPWSGMLTYVPIFSYVITETGEMPPIEDDEPIQATYAAGAKPLMCIANMEPGGVFQPEIARAIITNAEIREKVISNILAIVEAKGYAGVDSDIENIPRELQEGYVDFLRELKGRLGARPLTVAAPPKYDETTFAYARGHDYAGIGRTVDRVFIMNYEFHWVGGPPGAIGPLPQTRRVLLYAASLMPRSKIINGISTTAYDWPIPDSPETRARPWSHDRALQIAIENGVPIQYDETAQAPFFRYTEEGQEREVWFEDARSLMAKLMLVRELGIAGLGQWHLGAPNSQLRTLVGHLFDVIKH